MRKSGRSIEFGCLVFQQSSTLPCEQQFFRATTLRAATFASSNFCEQHLLRAATYWAVSNANNFTRLKNGAGRLFCLLPHFSTSLYECSFLWRNHAFNLFSNDTELKKKRLWICSALDCIKCWFCCLLWKGPIFQLEKNLASRTALDRQNCEQQLREQRLYEQQLSRAATLQANIFVRSNFASSKSCKQQHLRAATFEGSIFASSKKPREQKISEQQHASDKSRDQQLVKEPTREQQLSEQ